MADRIRIEHMTAPEGCNRTAHWAVYVGDEQDEEIMGLWDYDLPANGGIPAELAGANCRRHAEHHAEQLALRSGLPVVRSN